MADRSSIEWTEATWNPVVGCSIVSPGCTNCYAMKDAWRKNTNPRLPRYHGLTKMSKGGPVWTGEVRTVPELLDWPLRKKKPLRIFVNSMSDLFHEDVPDEFIAQVFGVMARARRHAFQILTKRAERMQQFMHRLVLTPHGVSLRQSGPLAGPNMPHVWLGVSVEDQRRADERIPLLLRTPAAVRWISAEPLLGPVDMQWALSHPLDIGAGILKRGHFAPGLETLRRLDWVVVGGESGPGARPFDITCARSLRDQCRAAGVPFFMKQTGTDHALLYERVQKDRKGGDPLEWPEDLRVREYPA